MLEKFEKIYLWMDNDGPGQEGANVFAQKLGMSRCYLVKHPLNGMTNPPKDANEALLNKLDLEKIILDAKVIQHDHVLELKDLVPDVLHEIRNPNTYTGDAPKSLPYLNRIIKGFRSGEMTIFSGSTGSGKTTFLCQISLDFAQQNINTLWGSFEIKNSRLCQKIFQQYLLDTPKVQDDLESKASQFSELPLYFMKFYGASDVNDVIDAMEYSVYVHDVKHVIIDNLQFMLSRKANSWKSSGFDKFDIQDVALEKFRKFASEKNVHVTLVVHPRKEEEGIRLGINSIYGSAKATQEADTVIILQKEGVRKYLDIKKNRFDGTIGKSPLFFDHQSSRYFESPPQGIDANKLKGSASYHN